MLLPELKLHYFEVEKCNEVAYRRGSRCQLVRDQAGNQRVLLHLFKRSGELTVDGGLARVHKVCERDTAREDKNNHDR